MDQDEPGRNSPHSGGQRPASTVRSYSRLRSYTGHGNLTLSSEMSSMKGSSYVFLVYLVIWAKDERKLNYLLI